MKSLVAVAAVCCVIGVGVIAKNASDTARETKRIADMQAAEAERQAAVRASEETAEKERKETEFRKFLRENEKLVEEHERERFQKRSEFEGAIKAAVGYLKRNLGVDDEVDRIITENAEWYDAFEVCESPITPIAEDLAEEGDLSPYNDVTKKATLHFLANTCENYRTERSMYSPEVRAIEPIEGREYKNRYFMVRLRFDDYLKSPKQKIRDTSAWLEVEDHEAVMKRFPMFPAGSRGIFKGRKFVRPEEAQGEKPLQS